eukprot:scaffold80865_cov65-Phaeocystis_antarctica.AAC.2
MVHSGMAMSSRVGDSTRRSTCTNQNTRQISRLYDLWPCTVPVEGGPREDRDRICVEVFGRPRQGEAVDANYLGAAAGAGVRERRSRGGGSGRGGAREGAVGQVGERRRCCAREAARGRQRALMAERLSCEGVATHVKSNLHLGTISSCRMRATTRFTWAIGPRSRSLQRLEACTDRQLEDDPAERWGKRAGKEDLLMVKAISSVATSPPINPIGRCSRSETLGHWIHSMASTASK